MATLYDISNRKDIMTIIHEQYRLMMKDTDLRPIFDDIVGDDILSHLEIVVDFWESALFQKGIYKGNMLEKHLAIQPLFPLKEIHFKKWLYCLNQAINHQYQGPNSKGMTQRAISIMAIIKLKLKEAERLRLERNN